MFQKRKKRGGIDSKYTFRDIFHHGNSYNGPNRFISTIIRMQDNYNMILRY